jgi:hypothetical protein
VRRTCVGSGSGHGGNETIAVDSNTLFGTSLGTDIWWKSYVYLYNPSSPGAAHWQQADGWQRYTASDTSQSAYTTPDGRLIITGGLVTTTRQEWTMPTHNFVYMEVLAWTKGTGFMWVVVPPNQVFAPALQSGAWCGYR